jgi:hypothetical protein
MESPQLDAIFLTKQLLLMGNLVRDYWPQVPTVDWQQLHHALYEKESYLVNAIGSATKQRQRDKAERALEELQRSLYDSLVRTEEVAKPA